MFAYNPTVNDNSGQIIGSGIVNSANTNAQAKVKLVDDIGSAVVSLAGAYGASKAQAAELQGYDEVFKMHGTQMGFSGEDIDRFLKMPDQQRRAAYTSLYENYLPQRYKMDYLNRQAELYPRTGGGGGGTGGGGGSGDYVVGGGWGG